MPRPPDRIDSPSRTPALRRLQRYTRSTLTWRSASGTAGPAARAAITLLLILLSLSSFGRLDLALYATFGAFAGVYDGNVATPRRWRVQARMGFILSAAVASGSLVALSPHRTWLVIPVAAAWASLAAALSDRQDWRPAGPMFIVFAVATCAAIPMTAANLTFAILVPVATAACAVALGAADVALATRSGRRLAPHTTPPPTPGPGRQRVQLIRCGLAVGAAGGIATAVGIGHPYWAMIAAVVPLAAFSLHDQLVRGAHRALGTVVGVGLAAGLLYLRLPDGAVIALVVVLQGLTELAVPRHYGLALIFITPLALLLVQLASPQPIDQLLADRLGETLIGVTVGLLTAVLTRRTTPATTR